MIGLIPLWIGILAFLPAAGTVSWVFYGLLLGRRYCARPTLAQLAWLGYAFIIAFAQIYSLWFKIDERALGLLLVVVCASGVCSVMIWRRLIARSVRRWSGNALWFVPAFIVAALYFSYCSVGPLSNYDTDLYHLNAVRWANSFAAVPGIVNLHGRLAFNSSFLLFAALTNVLPMAGRAAYVANGFLLFLASLHWTSHLLRPKESRRARLSLAFAALTLPFLVTSALVFYFPSLSTDLPFCLVFLVVILELLQTDVGLERQDKPSSSTLQRYRASLVGWFFIGSLAAVGFSTKLAGAPLCILLVFMLWHVTASGASLGLPWRTRMRHALALCALPLLILAGFFARNAVLSGWVVYPFPVGSLHLDWSASAEQVQTWLRSIESWARMPGERAEVVLGGGIGYWFLPWFFKLLHNGVAVLLSLLAVTGTLCTVSSPRLRRAFGGKRVSLGLSALVGVLGLTMWFLGAPDFRFGEAFFWAVAGTAGAPLVARLCGPKRWRLGLAATVMLCLVVGARYESGELSPSLFDPSGRTSLPPEPPSAVLSRVVLREGQPDQLIIYRPAYDDRCGNSLLPCSPHVEADSPLELRVPGDLQGGFRLRREN